MDGQRKVVQKPTNFSAGYGQWSLSNLYDEYPGLKSTGDEYSIPSSFQYQYNTQPNTSARQNQYKLSETSNTGSTGEGWGGYISAGVGGLIDVYNIWQSQQAERKKAEQLNKQWEDAYKFNEWKSKEDFAIRRQAIAADLAANQKNNLMKAYQMYIEGLAGARSDTVNAFNNIGAGLASGALTRARVAV